MQQITDGILNIIVDKSPDVPITPDGPGGNTGDGFNLAVPNTGFGDFINALGPTGCTIVTLAIVSFLITLIFFCLRSKLRHIRFLSVFEIGLVAFTIGFAIPAIVSTVDATNTNTVNLNITTKTDETTTATTTTNINIEPTTRAYMVYAYVENNSSLINTSNPEAIIKPTTPTTSEDPNSLTTNTYGIKTNTTGGFTSLSTDPKHPTLLYTEDTATTSGVLTITYGIKADSSLTAGTYTNINTSTENKIKYIVEPQHAFTLSYASAAPAQNMPISTTYGPAPTQEHIFTIPSDTENIPTRTDGYTFSGWCKGNVTTTTTTDTCDGDVYHPGDNITLDIDPTTATNPDTTTTINAMWKKTTQTTFSGISTMQEMTSAICANETTPTASATTETTIHTTDTSKVPVAILKDTRDDKTYTIAKLADGKCWMTQNLDYDLDTTKTLTSNDSNVTSSFTPERSTIAPGDLSSSTWTNDFDHPYSYDPGDEYSYTSGTTSDDTTYSSLSTCTAAGHAEAECKHYHVGNLYNWSASVASNDTSATVSGSLTTSICPKGWRLPAADTEPTDFGNLYYQSGITSTTSGTYVTDGFNNIRISPLWWVRAGIVFSGSRDYLGYYGYYWSNAVKSDSRAYHTSFNSLNAYPRSSNYRLAGFSVRCIAQ